MASRKGEPASGRRRRLIWASVAVLSLAALVFLGGLGVAHLSLGQGEMALRALERDPLPRSAREALVLYRRAEKAFERAALSPFHRTRAKKGLRQARSSMAALVERGFASGRFSPRGAAPLLDLLPSLGFGRTARAELALRLGRYRRVLRETAGIPSAESCRLGLAAALALGDEGTMKRLLGCLDTLSSPAAKWEREVRGHLWLVLGDADRAARLLGVGTASPYRLPLHAEAERRAGRPDRARTIIREGYDQNEVAQPLLRLAYLRTLVRGPKAPEALPWLATRLPAEGDPSPREATQQALYAAVLARHGLAEAAKPHLRRFLSDAPVLALDAKATWLPLYALSSRFRRTDLRYVHPDDLAPPIALAQSLLAQAGADTEAAAPYRGILWRLHVLEASAALLLLDGAEAERALAAAQKHGAPGQVLSFLRAVMYQVRGEPKSVEAELERLAPTAPSVARPWQALLALAAGNETRARALLRVLTETQRSEGPRLGRYLVRLVEKLLAARKAGQGKVADLSPTLSALWPKDRVALRRDLSPEVLSAPRGLAAPPEAVFLLLAAHPALAPEVPALLAAPGVPRVRAGEQLTRAHLTWLWARSRGDSATERKAATLVVAHRRLARAAPYLASWWTLFLW